MGRCWNNPTGTAVSRHDKIMIKLFADRIAIDFQGMQNIWNAQ